MSRSSLESHELTAGLARYAAEHVDEHAGRRFTSAQRISGGFSRETWSVSTIDAQGAAERWVVAVSSPRSALAGYGVGVDPVTQSQVLEYVRAGRVPAPKPIAASNEYTYLGQPFLATEHVDGQSDVNTLLDHDELASCRASFVPQMAHVLARLHALPPPHTVLGAPPARGLAAVVEDQREDWVVAGRAAARSWPELQRLVEYVAGRSCPVPPNVTLVHGDYRVGNFLYDHHGLTALLDWEMVHLGDPAEDVAWAQLVTWEFGRGLVGGLVQRSDWIDLYHRGVVRVTSDRVAFWEVVGCLKMATLALQARHARGSDEAPRWMARLVDELLVRAEVLTDGFSAAPALPAHDWPERLTPRDKRV